jgi:hypothetical protein
LTPVSTGVSVTDGCWAGERAISSIDLSIGGQRIDKHYQKWWRLYSELYMDNTERMNYGKMTSIHTTVAAAAVSERVYLPLIFFFNRNPGLYLPLIALQYHEVKIDINLNDTFDTYFDKSLSCWANYVFLDSEERKRFAQTGHEYLIEQVQHTGTDAVTNDSVKQVRLAYNHPVKDLVWCFSSTSNGANKDMWETTTPAAALTMTLDPDGSNFVPNISGVPLLTDNNFPLESLPAPNGVVTAVGPLSQFKLILNGQDRFKEQPGKYFNQVQPYQHYPGTPYPGIYAYSFALKPGDHQPTGTCNFSRIDNSVAWVRMKDSEKLQLNMFAVNYNILRVQSGMGGLAFSN